ncbi:MAG: MFS transporter [Woeseiaceae bacterium]|nr:MFS transporter [Woeseiaceae bacterium]
MSYRNLSILFVCQLISATGTFVLITLGGIIGSTLSANKALATLPVSLMVVSVAATTIPAALLMRRIGRKAGFALASLSAALSMVLATYALFTASFPWFVAAAAAFGINLAFTQQYRYAAAESVAPVYTGRAISLVLLGAIGGAIVGPELIARGEVLIDGKTYAGTLAGLAVLFVVQSILLLFLGPLRGEDGTQITAAGRPLREIVTQPLFAVAVLGGTAAYGVMTLIMTATPLSMHVHDGYSINETANVIRSHVLAMYVPSLVSGFLIERLGTVRMMMAGATALLLACIVGLQGQSVSHYLSALILLGVGWNFLYVGGTTMLTLTYAINERFKAQAVNDFCVFGTSATASLLAGTVVHAQGWYTLIVVPLPLLLLCLTSLFLVRRDRLLHRPASQAV